MKKNKSKKCENRINEVENLREERLADYLKEIKETVIKLDMGDLKKMRVDLYHLIDKMFDTRSLARFVLFDRVYSKAAAMRLNGYDFDRITIDGIDYEHCDGGFQLHYDETSDIRI